MPLATSAPPMVVLVLPGCGKVKRSVLWPLASSTLESGVRSVETVPANGTKLDGSERPSTKTSRCGPTTETASAAVSAPPPAPALIEALIEVTPGAMPVTRPPALAVAIAGAAEVKVTPVATAACEPSEKAPVTVTCAVAPRPRAAVAPESAIDTSVGGGSVTLTVAEAVRPGAPEEAVVVAVSVAWPLATARTRPAPSMVATPGALLEKATSGSALMVFGLAFAAIYREMFETVIFFRGLLVEVPDAHGAVALGAGVGLVLLGALVALFQKLGRKLKPRPLLLTCGVLLCGLAVLMVGNGVRSLQEVGLLPLTVWGGFQLPALGVYATREGLLAQALVFFTLVGSALWSATRHAPHPAHAT